MFLEPQDFRRRKPRKHGIPERFDGFLLAAEFSHDLVAFRRSRRVAPQFGRPNYLPRLVQRHKAMLLPAHANGFDLGSHRASLAQCPPDRARRRIPPRVRMLFLGARGQVGNQFVFLGRGGDDFSLARVHYQHLCRLCAAVNP